MSEQSNHTRIRLGMVGGGQGAFIGAVHRFAARMDDRYQLVAGALSSDPERARTSAAQLNIDPERAYTDYREMARIEAQRPDGIEVVSIVTPNHLHYPIASAFIEAGIAVICDKPLTTTLADALALFQLAQERDCLFALTHNYSGYPLVRAARSLVAAGELGDIRVVQVEYAQDWLAEPIEMQGQKQASWRTDPSIAGPAGCLGDIGTHAAHLAEFVTGMAPSELSAELVSFVPGRQVDDHVQIQLRYPNGARGMLWASQVATGEQNHLRLRIYGSKGAIAWDQEQPDELWLHKLGGAAQRLTRGMANLPLLAQLATRTPGGHPEGYLEAFAQIYSDFAEQLRARRTNRQFAVKEMLVPGLADGVRSLNLVETALESHRLGGAWLEVQSPI